MGGETTGAGDEDAGRAAGDGLSTAGGVGEATGEAGVGRAGATGAAPAATGGVRATVGAAAAGGETTGAGAGGETGGAAGGAGRATGAVEAAAAGVGGGATGGDGLAAGAEAGRVAVDADAVEAFAAGGAGVDTGVAATAAGGAGGGATGGRLATLATLGPLDDVSAPVTLAEDVGAVEPAGTATSPLQCGHLIFFPPSSGFSRSGRPQAGQSSSIVMAAGVGKRGGRNARANEQAA